MAYQHVSWTGEPVNGLRLSRVQNAQHRLKNNQTPQEIKFYQELLKYCDHRSMFWVTIQKTVYVHAEQAFILDFYFKAFKLAVELDGRHHANGIKFVEDEWRTRILNEHGIQVLRFQNDEVDSDAHSCVLRVIDWMSLNGKGWKIRELRKHLSRFGVLVK